MTARSELDMAARHVVAGWLRGAAFQLRCRIFPWTLPRKLRVGLGVFGLFWLLFTLWGIGVLMGARAVTAAAAAGMAVHLVLAVVLVGQMPKACRTCAARGGA
jgi:hypothetical protein